MTQRIRSQLATEKGLCAAVVFLALLLGTSAVAWAQAQGQGETPERKIVIDDQTILVYPGGYIRDAECLKCHEKPEGEGYRDSLHSRAWNGNTPAANRGCETCHGPGASHAEDTGKKGLVRDFKTMAPREASEACLTGCHEREEHANWQGSMHDARNVTCVSCHSNHTPKSEGGQLVGASVVETCGNCHRDKAAKMLRSGHMPVREGKLDCSTCHNNHGSTNVRMLREGNTVNEACTGCHAEKRGPFLWDHPPVRDNCSTCHDPHGSSNESLLVAKPPMLCQRCHIASRHPATIYDAVALTSRSNRLIGRSCVTCHQNFHGSNHPSGAFYQR